MLTLSPTISIISFIRPAVFNQLHSEIYQNSENPVWENYDPPQPHMSFSSGISMPSVWTYINYFFQAKSFKRSCYSWPGYLNNTVAGSIPSSMLVFESLVKESMEEASLAVDFVRENAKAVGCVSYFMR
jgi:hypothetical protein